MSISRILDTLYDNTARYSAILKKEQQQIIRRYSDPHMGAHFKTIRYRAISIGPMALCDSLLKDLEIRSPEKLLAGIGVLTFHISAPFDFAISPRDDW